MNLISLEAIRHSDEKVEDFDMDTNSTIRVKVEEFEVVGNYNKGEEAGVMEEIKKGLRVFVKELERQVEAL